MNALLSLRFSLTKDHFTRCWQLRLQMTYKAQCQEYVKICILNCFPLNLDPHSMCQEQVEPRNDGAEPAAPHLVPWGQTGAARTNIRLCKRTCKFWSVDWWLRLLFCLTVFPTTVCKCMCKTSSLITVMNLSLTISDPERALSKTAVL